MKFWTILCAVFMLIGFTLFIAGILVNDMDSMWMIFVGFFLLVTFLICTVLFWRQARLLQSMFEGQNLLIHWFFQPETVLAHSIEEIAGRKRMNFVLWLIIAGFVVLFTVLFAIFGDMEERELLLFVSIMLGVLVLCGLAAWLAPLLAEKKIKRATPEAFVGKKAAWVFGEFDIWNSPLTKFKKASLVKISDPGTRSSEDETKPRYQIEIVYDQMQRYGYQERTVHIPVPPGEEDAARVAIEHIIESN
jgi:hypothetical protein